MRGLATSECSDHGLARATTVMLVLAVSPVPRLSAQGVKISLTV